MERSREVTQNRKECIQIKATAMHVYDISLTLRMKLNQVTFFYLFVLLHLF